MYFAFRRGVGVLQYSSFCPPVAGATGRAAPLTTFTHGRSAPVRRQTRTLVPSASNRYPHAGGLAVLGADDGNVRDRHRHLLVDDPALHGLMRVGFWCFLAMLTPFDDDRALVGVGEATTPTCHDPSTGRDPSRMSTTRPAIVPFLESSGHQRTSGASETMRMKRLSRSSRTDGAEDAGPAGLALFVDEDRRVLVEPDVGTIRPALLPSWPGRRRT